MYAFLVWLIFIILSIFLTVIALLMVCCVVAFFIVIYKVLTSKMPVVEESNTHDDPRDGFPIS